MLILFRVHVVVQPRCRYQVELTGREHGHGSLIEDVSLKKCEPLLIGMAEGFLYETV